MAEKHKILLIEDNKNIVFVAKLFLETHGFEVLVAEDGVQGLEIAASEKPDLILLDILIPKMNGYQVLEALQSNQATRAIPILVTSAKAQLEDIKEAFHFNIRGYLVKPFATEELLVKIREVFKIGLN